MTFDGTKYDKIIFIDSNVVLEGNELSSLPWQEIVEAGDILLCIVPQVAREIDKYKSHSRLGERSRNFNRIIRPFFRDGKPVELSTKPNVYLAYIRYQEIEWNYFPQLMSDDPDSLVIAQVLRADIRTLQNCLFISHDINPIALAYSSGLPVFEMPIHWLRNKQPSPEDKEKQRMKSRIRDLEAREPSLELNLHFEEPASTTFPVYQVAPLTHSQKVNVKNILTNRARREMPSKRTIGFSINEDPRYEEKMETFIEYHIPFFAEHMHTIVQLFFNQTPFQLKVRNISKVHACDMIVHVQSDNARLHDKVTWFPLTGPSLPKYESRLDLPDIIKPRPLRQRDRNEVELTVAPERGRFFELSCDDFRQNREYRLDAFAIPNEKIGDTLGFL